MALSGKIEYLPGFWGMNGKFKYENKIVAEVSTGGALGKANATINGKEFLIESKGIGEGAKILEKATGKTIAEISYKLGLTKKSRLVSIGKKKLIPYLGSKKDGVRGHAYCLGTDSNKPCINLGFDAHLNPWKKREIHFDPKLLTVDEAVILKMLSRADSINQPN